MTLPKLRMDFNLGQLIAAGASLAGFVMTLVTVTWWLSAQSTGFTLELAKIRSDFELRLANMTANQQRDIADINARASRYGPVLDGLVRSQDVQDERISNLANTAQETRKANSEILSKLSSIAEDVASLKARAGTIAR